MPKWEDVILAGGWGYKTDLIDLSKEFGIPGDRWVRFIPTVWLPISVQQSIDSMKTAWEDSGTSEEDKLTKLVASIGKVIVEWNLPYLKLSETEDSRTLPLPAKGESAVQDAVENVPSVILLTIFQRAQEDDGSVPLAKRSGSTEPSSPLDQPLLQTALPSQDGQASLL